MELWKRSEQIRFEQHLREVEKAQQAEFRASLAKVKSIETKLKSKIIELEDRERGIKSCESDVEKAKEEFDRSLKRQAELHQTALKQLNEQHAFSLKLEKEKLRAEEARRKQLELELINRDHSGGKKKKVSENQKDLDLQLDLKMKQFELDQALDREKQLLKSRDHFRSSVIKLTAEKLNKNPGVMLRLQQQRAELITSGLYSEGDEVILQIDSKIDKASYVL